MTRSVKAVALAALLAVGSAAAIEATAGANHAPEGYIVARAQTGGEIINGDTSTGPVTGVY